ncbi:MAG: STAS/SEC14 domain-containing protein [Bacteroidales bacterium]|nr:STAS/SEC14 domain-containing protein [Bacteroidales bacterium]
MNKTSLENLVDISYESDDILIMRMHDRSNIDIEQAEKIHAAASELSGDRMHGNLVDIRKMTYMSSEARKYFGKQNKQTVKAVAVISNSAIHKPLVNLYLKFSRPSIPTRFFDTEEAALSWLRSILGN